jgi:hypothetical protein
MAQADVFWTTKGDSVHANHSVELIANYCTFVTNDQVPTNQIHQQIKDNASVKG